MIRTAIAAFGLAALFAAPASAQFNLTPEAPQANEPIIVRATPGVNGCDIVVTRDITTTMSGNRITVTLPVIPGTVCFATAPPARSVYATVGALPAGDYQVEVLRKVDATATSMGTKSFTVPPRKPVDPIANYTDLWWDPGTSGWGLNVIHHPSNMIFATWFEYDGDGRPGWYVVPEGTWSTGGNPATEANFVFDGLVYRTSGPTNGTLDPSQVHRFLVGTARFWFGDWNRLDVDMTISGRARRLTLQRQGF